MKKKVVIVDDSKFLLQMLRGFLEGAGYEVPAAGGNGAQAVELFRKHRPDLLTLDLTMPVKDGKTALGEILSEFPDARVLIISALSGSSMLECMKQGARGYIEKPLRLEDEEFRKDFLATLEEALVESA